jgi:hypothetical protein
MDQPLKLVTEETNAGVKVEIVGDSDVACAVEYELEVQSGGTGNTNRSVQRGKARLLPNQKVTVAKAMIGSGPSAEWQARLLVKPCSGPSYEESVSEQGFGH